jgi:hypothetical protein
MQLTAQRVKGFFFGQSFLHIISFSVLIFSILTFFATFTAGNFDATFNSDAVGVPYIFKDIFIDGGHFHDWQLAAAPTLFPDMGLYYLLFQIFGKDFLTITFVYGLIQTLLVAGLSVYIFRKLVKSRNREFSWMIPIFYCFVFFESYYLLNDQMLGYLMIMYCYHGGAFVCTLLSFALVISDLKLAMKAPLLFVIAGLSIFSDLLYVTMFIAPIVALQLVQFRYKGLKTSALYTGLILGGALLGYLIFNNNSTNHASVADQFNMSKIKTCIDVMYVQMDFEFRKKGFQSFLTYAAYIGPIIAFFIVIIFRKKLEPSLKYFIWFYVLFTVSTIAVPLLVGSYDSTDKIRYISGAFFFSAIVLAFLCSWMLSTISNFEWLKAGLSYTMIIVFFFLTFDKFKLDGLVNYFSYYPPKIRAMDELCKENGLTRGIGYYWNGKWASMFSRNNITVVTVYPSTNIYEFGSNREWFFKGTYDFVIPEAMDSAEIRKNFVILDTLVRPEITLLKVKKFIYPYNEPMPKTIE